MSLCVLLKTRLKTPWQTLMDHKGMFNCRLLRPAVIGLICHSARLAGRQGGVSWGGVEAARMVGQERGASLLEITTTVMMIVHWAAAKLRQAA